jgi:hypothetical protein
MEDNPVMSKNSMMHKTLATVAMLSLLTLAGCAKDPVPDDQRSISQSEKDKMINAQLAPNTSAEQVAPKPSMGPGLNTAAPAPKAEPIDNGKTIMFPTLTETELVPNEKVTLYAGQLTPGKTYGATIFYSANGQNDKTIPLGEWTVTEAGEISEKVTLPANLAKGSYVVALNIDDSLYTAPIKVG